MTTTVKLRAELKAALERVAAATHAADQLQAQISRLENNCNHAWGETKSNSERTEGYTVKGDPPGVGGIDHRSDFYVPPSTKTYWTRACTKCGRVERTNATTTKTVEVPRW